MSAHNTYALRCSFDEIVCCPEIYGSFSAYQETIGLYHDQISRMPSSAEKASAELGLLYIERYRSPLPASVLLRRARAITSPYRHEMGLQAKTRFVIGAILVSTSHDYRNAIRILSPLFTSAASKDILLYGLVAAYIGWAQLRLGDAAESEITHRAAVMAFRQVGSKVHLAWSLNSLAVLMKRRCQYSEGIGMLKEALRLVREGTPLVAMEKMFYTNLGIIYHKSGDSFSRKYLERALSLYKATVGPLILSEDQVSTALYRSCDMNLEHLLISRREFSDAESRLRGISDRFSGGMTTPRENALLRLNLGRLYTEMGRSDLAAKYLCLARIDCLGPIERSDVGTATLRWLACALEKSKKYEEAKQVALDCVRLSRDIGDAYECGAALRTLGHCHLSLGQPRRATSCFEASIRALRSINATHETMRTIVDYAEILIATDPFRAEQQLAEAQRTAHRIEIPYFRAIIAILVAELHTSMGRFEEARRRLSEASCELAFMHSIDRDTVANRFRRASDELDKQIVRVSMKSAETLKTMCQVYEEARFPMREIKSDLAYQVAHSIEADSLFLARRKGRGYEVPLCYNLPKNEAKETLRRLDRDRSEPFLGLVDTPRVFQTYTGRVMVSVISSGASTYALCAQYPDQTTLSPRQLEFMFAGAEALERVVNEDEKSSPSIGDDFIERDGSGHVRHPRGSFKDILTVEPDLIKLIRLAERASLSEAPILLEGETGVGKELFAQAIHLNSRRKDRPFVPINAGGLPVNLLESQLFGHVKGAYTDAVTDRAGLVDEAKGGTLFFDEAGEMGEELQVKLLRLLENGEYRLLGDNKTHTADVRIISATNRELSKEVERGRFRKDLYYRLGTVKLTIPPLRFRQRDIQLLVRHFLIDCARRNRLKQSYFEIDAKALEALELYDWPGNVRELYNEILRIVSLIGGGDTIRFGMLSEPIKTYVTSKNKTDGLLERSMERIERRFILDALHQNDWNRLRTAEAIGIPRTTLLAKMKRLNIAVR